MTIDLIGPSYYADTYYKSASYQKKLADCQTIEASRQRLMARIAATDTLAYARFLLAVESDATLSHGRFGSFKLPKNADLLRAFPIFNPMISQETPHDH